MDRIDTTAIEAEIARLGRVLAAAQAYNTALNGSANGVSPRQEYIAKRGRPRKVELTRGQKAAATRARNKALGAKAKPGAGHLK